VRVGDSLHKSAVKAARAVEERCLGQPGARGPRAQADAQLLERFKSKYYKDKVIEAWTEIQDCGASAEDEQQVIKAMLDARWHAEMVRGLAADREMERTLLGLKGCAETLHDYFLHTQDVLHARRVMLRQLDRAQRFFEEKIAAFSEITRGPRVSREVKTPAGRRGVFMFKTFNTRLDVAVAALTDVAFKRPVDSTTVKQVMNARMYRRRRAKVN
jgi:hypothetical protein